MGDMCALTRLLLQDVPPEGFCADRVEVKCQNSHTTTYRRLHWHDYPPEEGSKDEPASAVVVLVIEGHLLQARKGQLIQHSDYFRAMFESNMKESTQREIELHGINYQAMKSILKFFDKEELDLSHELVHYILDAGHQFQLPLVVKACVHFLSSKLTVDNVLEVLDLADHYCSVDLLKAVFRLIRERFSELLSKGTLLDMSSDQLKTLLESDLHIHAKEYELFSMCKHWVEKNMEERIQYAKQIFPYVKYHLMSMADLSRIQQQADTWLNEVEEFAQLLKSAFRFKNEVHNQVLLQCWHTQPRGAKDTLHIFREDTSILTIESPLQCQIWNPQMQEFMDRTLRNHWETDSYAVVVWSNFLYIAGGFDVQRDSSVSSVFRYDPTMQRWIRVQQMIHKREAFYLGVLGDKLYAVAGRCFPSQGPHFGIVLDKVEAYNSATDSWSPATCMPFPLHEHAGTVCENKLYISGGKSNFKTEVRDELFCFDSTEESWELCSRMQQPRSHHNMATIGHKVFIAGGSYYENRSSQRSYGTWIFVQTFECFDTHTKQFSILEPLPHRRTQLAMGVLGSTIYAVGGMPVPGVDGHRVVMEYDTKEEKWKTSLLTYLTYWPTKCCVLKLSPAHFGPSLNSPLP